MEADFGLGNPSVTIPCYREQTWPASLAPVDVISECKNGIHAKQRATNNRAVRDLFGNDTYRSCLCISLWIKLNSRNKFIKYPLRFVYSDKKAFLGHQGSSNTSYFFADFIRTLSSVSLGYFVDFFIFLFISLIILCRLR